jgi:hypothetical protein
MRRISLYVLWEETQKSLTKDTIDTIRRSWFPREFAPVYGQSI